MPDGVSSVPPIVYTPVGYVAPDEADVLAGVIADTSAACGGNMNTTTKNPLIQIATTETALIGNSNDQFVFFANQTDPAYAEGRFQDGIGRIYFLERNPAQPTAVPATCIGAAGTIIPAGSQAQATDGNIYVSLDTVTIPVGGSILVSFACTITGPIACPAGSLNFIYRQVPGWDTVSNPTDGVLGNDVESRADFEFRREASIALNSVGTNDAVRGLLLAVPNVIDAYVIDNSTSSNVVNGNITLLKNSIYCCVAGGDPQVIANTIWTKKMPGCGYTGSTTETVTDTNAGYQVPYPTYSVSFQIAAGLSTLFIVNIKNSSMVPSDALTQVQNAIISAFSGGDGGPRARIGSLMFASRYYGVIAALGTWAQEIISILIGSANTPTATFTGSIAGTVMTVTGSPTGTIAVGQYIAGSGVLSATTITSLGSGSGGAGTYNVSRSQTVSSETMRGSVAGSTTVQAGIDQIQTIVRGNIQLVLS